MLNVIGSTNLMSLWSVQVIVWVLYDVIPCPNQGYLSPPIPPAPPHCLSFAMLSSLAHPKGSQKIKVVKPMQPSVI